MIDSRFARAVDAFRAISERDPERRAAFGRDHAREWLDAERLVRWIERLDPNASEPLRLAAYCQHLGRYLTPRSTYPEGRIGYLKWRTDLAKAHAARSAEVLARAGYDPSTIEAVRLINLKQGLRVNPDVQTMEDALCLSFLEHDFDEFAAKHDDPKLIEILVKTWRKMSPRARELALALPLSGRAADLVTRALSSAEEPAGEGS